MHGEARLAGANHYHDQAHHFQQQPVAAVCTRSAFRIGTHYLQWPKSDRLLGSRAICDGACEVDPHLADRSAQRHVHAAAQCAPRSAPASRARRAILTCLPAP